MRIPFSRNQVRLAAACAFALGVLSGNAGAQVAPNDERSLLRDGSGQFVKNGFGECWHSGVGPGPTPNAECGPQPMRVRPVSQQFAPEPKLIVAAAPAVAYERVTFDANVLFAFGKSSLSPAGRDTLDGFVAKTRDFVNPDSMIAVGYADRIGSDDQNQTLSNERVAAVKTYLVSKGIEAGRVDTSGRGESRPTTRGECDGPANAKNIACLQPDRHVYIELSGTRIKP